MSDMSTSSDFENMSDEDIMGMEAPAFGKI